MDWKNFGSLEFFNALSIDRSMRKMRRCARG
jgi:hypothetical protein